MKEFLRNVFFRIWYWYISSVDKNADVIFMNYGYSNNNLKIKLNETDIKNRYSIQLYDFVARGTKIADKDILEVGCGRGGGLSYINRYMSPKSATGIDLNKKAIEFCQNYYSGERTSFVQGNAQSLDFEDASFDVVINVESSHRYPEVDKFLKEVYRVLKPGGYFLFTDFRHQNHLEMFNKQMKDSKLITIKEEFITKNILEALNLSNTERINLIKRIAPKFLQGLAKKFAATKGTPTYNKFANREFEYLYIISKKGT